MSELPKKLISKSFSVEMPQYEIRIQFVFSAVTFLHDEASL